jgi:short-subunit dehydrogenase
MKIRKALVTGGSSGIGLSICEHLLSEGVEVYSISRNPLKVSKNKNLTEIAFDLANSGKISNFVDNFISQHGLPDLLVNNAGYGAFFDLNQFSDQEILLQTSVLFTSPVILCKTFAPKMEEAGQGIIVNVTSLATLYPLPYMSLYNANKSALSAFTQSMQFEYDKFPRWIDFRLGDIKTSFNKSAPKQEEKIQNAKMRNAWIQIEKQLDESPSPEVASRQLFKAISKEKQGVVYGGSFFHAQILPLIYRFIPNFLIIKLLQKYYYD